MLLELKEKNVLLLMSGDRKKVKEFADEQDLSFKDPADVVRIVSFYNKIE